MAPQRDPDIQFLAQRPVVFEQQIVPVVHEVQHGRMDDDELRPDALRVPTKLQHHVHILVGA